MPKPPDFEQLARRAFPVDDLRGVKDACERLGYRFEVSADGTEERMIRADGSVAFIARKKPHLMPESPDFDQIARRLTDQANAIVPLTKGMIYYDIKDALRQVWNARGAADVAGLPPILMEPERWDAITEAIKKLDR